MRFILLAFLLNGPRALALGGFEPITPTTLAWSMKGDAMVHADGPSWTGIRSKAQAKGYADLEADLDVSKGQANLFIHATRFHANSLPIDGYYYQANTGFLYRGFGWRTPVLNGVSELPILDRSRVHVRLRDNYGVIEVFVDGQRAIRVIDPWFEGGHWGFSGQGVSGAVAHAKFNASPRPPRPVIPTPAPTPKAAIQPSLCPSPWPAVWQARKRAVLTPDFDFEKGSVSEPSVIKIGSTYHMTYSANAFNLYGLPATIGLAVSDDGISWKHYGKDPVLGNHVGGEDAVAVRSSQIQIGNEYYIYYKDKYGSICRAVSTDGYAYSKVSTTVIPFNCLNQYKIVGFDSVGFSVNAQSGVISALVDANYGVTSGDQFRLWLFESRDKGATFQSICEMTSLPRAKTAYGSPRALVKIGDFWHLWYLYGVPSQIFEALSPDLYNWTSYSAMTLDYSQHMFGLQNCNQAADTCLLDMGKKLYMYYDGTDNTAAPATFGFGCGMGYPAGPGGVIGMAVYEGSLQDYGACGR